MLKNAPHKTSDIPGINTLFVNLVKKFIFKK